MKKRLFSLTIITVFSFFAVSCASIVKPGAKKVKKVALLSFKANKAMINRKDDSTITALATLAEGNLKGGNPVLASLLSKTSSGFIKDLNNIEQFQVISGSSVTGNSAYKTMLGKMKSLWGDLYQGSKVFFYQPLDGYSVLPSGWEIGRNLSKKHKDQSNEILANAAKALGVDAVVLVDLDLGYEPSLAIGGTGAARASVYIGVYMINKDGEEAIIVYPSEKYGSSGGTLGIVGGNVFFNQQTMPIFAREVNAAMEKVMKDIEKGL